MPQASIPYAVARVRMLSQQALKKNDLERLLQTKTYKEAKKILSEIGWGSVQGADEEKLTIEYLNQAYDLVKKITPSEALTDCFLIRYDIHNAKTLIKARELKRKTDFLSTNGIVPLPILEHSITERNYKKIPELLLKEALEEIEVALAIEFDPFLVDSLLDKTLYKIIFSKLNMKKPKKTVEKYFVAKVDLLNGLMLLRTLQMGKEKDFFKQILIPYGSFSMVQWEVFFEEPEELVKAIKEKHGENIAYRIYDALQDETLLPMLEKKIDDHLLKIFEPFRKDPTALESFLSYLIAVEREAAGVRLIMSSKANGFSEEAVRERMRDIYG